VRCPRCHAENREEAQFCEECGGRLEISCPVHPPTSPADDIPRSRRSLQGECRHVTLLFSDLSGYTAMSEKLDPEEVKEITTRIFGEAAVARGLTGTTINLASRLSDIAKPGEILVSRWVDERPHKGGMVWAR